MRQSWGCSRSSFRPPYSIDQEPDTNDQAAPVDRVEQMGYIIVGDKIDTDDWNEHPRKTPQEIIDTVLNQLEVMKTKPQFRGSIILMHDGGGDRSVTVATLPLLIDTLRAKGYKIVPVSALIGKTRDQVMPPIPPKQRWQARIDAIAFWFLSFFAHTVVLIFIRWRHPDDGTAGDCGIVRGDRSRAQTQAACGCGELSAGGCGADSGIQRRESDCANDSFRAGIELSQAAGGGDRRWLDGQHAGRQRARRCRRIWSPADC